ncbi:MAG TPA: hypothetical protein VF292_02860 [Rhodanobacteraceae bacterium]
MLLCWYPGCGFRPAKYRFHEAGVAKREGERYVCSGGQLAPRGPRCDD